MTARSTSPRRWRFRNLRIAPGRTLSGPTGLRVSTSASRQWKTCFSSQPSMRSRTPTGPSTRRSVPGNSRTGATGGPSGGWARTRRTPPPSRRSNPTSAPSTTLNRGNSPSCSIKPTWLTTCWPSTTVHSRRPPPGTRLPPVSYRWRFWVSSRPLPPVRIRPVARVPTVCSTRTGNSLTCPPRSRIPGMRSTSGLRRPRAYRSPSPPMTCVMRYTARTPCCPDPNSRTTSAE